MRERKRPAFLHDGKKWKKHGRREKCFQINSQFLQKCFKKNPETAIETKKHEEEQGKEEKQRKRKACFDKDTKEK